MSPLGCLHVSAAQRKHVGTLVSPFDNRAPCPKRRRPFSGKGLGLLEGRYVSSRSGRFSPTSPVGRERWDLGGTDVSSEVGLLGHRNYCARRPAPALVTLALRWASSAL
ncbi:hypothetical protein HPB47_016224 [Ixodes persulcatus]|uniref:Uncharacterized protein n=1 Tax=Ixodes persulcatus TaxID=34615 RepID=A0AC60QSM8_IXOPE|nr:hypothetical protein HPB47_016224 [Ixodes persulcatus]